MPNSSAARWPDLYALLSVAPDADEETLRRRIREAYQEATTNADHRNMERRIHYQTMAERIVPQCRRILLDPKIRSEYDLQMRLHREKSPAAIDYTEFLRSVPGSGVVSSGQISLPGKQSETQNAANTAATATPAEDNSAWLGIPSIDDGTPAPAAAAPAASAPGVSKPIPDDEEEENPQPLASVAIPDVQFAPESMPDLADMPDAFLRAPAPAAPANAPAETGAGVPAPADSSPAEAAPAEPVLAQPDPVQPVSPEPAVAGPATGAPEPAPAAAPAAPVEESTPAATTSAPEPDDIRAATLPADVAAAISDPDANSSTPETLRGGRIRQSGPRKLRVRGGGSTTTISDGDSGRRLLSHRVQMLLTAIAAAGLTIFIMRAQRPASKVPLRVAYASGLQTFMDGAAGELSKSPEGASIELQMQPVDSRAAMLASLSGKPFADVWIPSESLWSNRFNAVASSKTNVKPIVSASPLALSPYVLLVHADHAAALRRQFPGHLISSWAALRAAVTANAPGHFGLSDPVRSGSGAVVRYFMAREWCEKNGVAWNPEAARNKGLSQWMGAFEENVPVSARISADMVKDLALGTGSRYWWAIALESEGLAWMKAGKPLEIFYLPQTTYADHPVCFLSPADATDQTISARSLFDKFLRSDGAQKELLQRGYRPTGIELTTKVTGNPFTDAKMKERGLRTEGFKVDERIKYRILNALSAEWSKQWDTSQ